MNTFGNTILEKFITLVLGIIIIPTIVYNALGLLTGYSGNFDLIMLVLGIVSYFSIIIAYRAISNTTLRDTALFSSFIITLLGADAYKNQMPHYILALTLMVFASFWLIAMGKRLGFPTPLYPIKILLGLACIMGTYVITCSQYTGINSNLFYWVLFVSVIVFIIGLQLILSGFGLTVTQCIPEKD